eukprot:scaffold8708_cov157-Skeletonema_marinoi.AAC.7
MLARSAAVAVLLRVAEITIGHPLTAHHEYFSYYDYLSTCPLANETGTEIVSPTGSELNSISLDVEQANDDTSIVDADASPKAKAKTMKASRNNWSMWDEHIGSTELELELEYLVGLWDEHIWQHGQS